MCARNGEQVIIRISFFCILVLDRFFQGRRGNFSSYMVAINETRICKKIKEANEGRFI